MSILFEVDGETLINRRLLRVGAYARDASPAFAAIADLLMEETKAQFATEGSHASGGWKPLQPATVAEKARHGMRPEILQRTGSLLDSLTVKGDSNMILEIHPDSLTFGSRLPYADIHQKGSPKTNLPRRPPLAFTESAKRAVVKVLQRWIIVGEL